MPAVDTTATPASVVSVNPVTLGDVPVIADTLYTVPVAYPVMVPVPPNVPVMVMRSSTASVDAPHVNCPAVPDTATVATSVPVVVAAFTLNALAVSPAVAI